MSNWLGLREDQRTGESLSALLWLELSSLEAWSTGIESRRLLACDLGGSAGEGVAARTPSQASLLQQCQVFRGSASVTQAVGFRASTGGG